VKDRNNKKSDTEENSMVSKSYWMLSEAQQRQRDISERKASPTRRRILKIAAKSLIKRDILQVPVMKDQTHVFSFKREEPTARSVVDQGEFSHNFASGAWAVWKGRRREVTATSKSSPVSGTPSTHMSVHSRVAMFTR